MSDEKFPFMLEDIAAWLIRRKDGTIVRYNLIDSAAGQKKSTKIGSSSVGKSTPAYLNSGWKQSYSSWCEEHAPQPTGLPVFEAEGIRLHIANSTGARKVAKLHDVAIDGGNVLDVAGEND